MTDTALATVGGAFATAEIEDADARIQTSIDALRNGSANVFSTMNADSFEQQIALASAVQNSEPLSDHLGETIPLRHIVVQKVLINDTENVGTDGVVPVIPVARILLVTDDGKAYHSISTGIFKAVENILGMVKGVETWPKPVPVKAVKEGKAPRAYYTLKLA